MNKGLRIKQEGQGENKIQNSEFRIQRITGSISN